MKVSQRIEEGVAAILGGHTFRYSDLGIPPVELPAATKAMERLLRKGAVVRVSKGFFYVPKPTAFGSLRPSETELIKPYLFRAGKRVAYITGLRLYNQMGLTTQVSKGIQIASYGRRPRPAINGLEVFAAKSYAEVTADNYEVLGLLDAIKDFPSIPDMDPEAGIAILRAKVADAALRRPVTLVELGMCYPPRVRATLGALLEGKISAEVTEKLYASLNPLSWYKMGLSESLLPNSRKWNIK